MEGLAGPARAAPRPLWTQADVPDWDPLPLQITAPFSPGNSSFSEQPDLKLHPENQTAYFAEPVCRRHPLLREDPVPLAAVLLALIAASSSKAFGDSADEKQTPTQTIGSQGAQQEGVIPDTGEEAETVY